MPPEQRSFFKTLLALANAPALITGPQQWLHFWTFNSDRGADLGSLWLVVLIAVADALLDRLIELAKQVTPDPDKPLVTCSDDGAEKYILGPAEVAALASRTEGWAAGVQLAWFHPIRWYTLRRASAVASAGSKRGPPARRSGSFWAGTSSRPSAFRWERASR